ncbi:MAG: hypothetical protein ACT4PM_11520 [Gemmatimonadales bacterium]
MTELGGAQISSLMEVLPGIAQVLRSPVADAIVNVVRAAARLREFDLADAEELLRYGVRRNLLTAEESERVLAEVREGARRAAERPAVEKKPAARPKSPSRPKARASGKAKTARKPASRSSRPKKKAVRR